MKTTYYVAATLDGFIADPEGSVDFLALTGGEPDPEPYNEFFSSVDALLMGRRTYDQVLSFGDWPYGDTPCWVMTNTALKPTSLPVQALSGSPSDIHQQIAAAGRQHLWIVGGGNIAAQFLSARHLDSVIVSVMPVLLGQGVKLFSGLTKTSTLVLSEQLSRANGVAELRYSPK